jgi:cellulose synthase/poly-beta-1,6-N-acetylglucosamine synthase-like glycosyltransferase
MSSALAVAPLVIAALLVCAYVIWLISTGPASPSRAQPVHAPSVLIIVPVYDEAFLIAGKLANLAALTFPTSKRRVVVVDGGSTDDTVEQVGRWVAERPECRIVRTNLRNKTAQINMALRQYPAEEWVLITDADAILPPDTVERLLSVVDADPAVGVVGARVRPRASHSLERLHWRLADWLREREYRRGSAAIVTAPCYLARRRFLTDLPADTVADDIHVACRAMLAGCRVGLGSPTVFEQRSPRSFIALCRHKYRKADAYLREVFRFLPDARRMPLPMRNIFIWRAALLTIVPMLFSLACIGGAMAIATGTHTIARAEAAMMSIAVMAVLASPRGRDAARFAALAVVLMGVSLSALLNYPFSRQTASFRKVHQPSDYPFCEDPE